MDELKKLIEEQGKAWEAFQKAHAQQIQELKTGKADAVLNDKIEKLGQLLDALEAKKTELEKKLVARVDELEKKFNRPGLGGAPTEDETKALVAFNVQCKALARARGDSAPADATLDDYKLYKGAVVTYMRKGPDALSADERKALIVGSDPDGGYFVTPDVTGRIVTKLFDLSPIRQIADVQVISSDRLEGIEDLDEASFGWVAETGARTETNTPKIQKYEIPAHEMYASPKASQKLLDDSSVDVESWLANKVTDKFSRGEGTAFVSGVGVGRPRGFTTYPTAATADATRAWGTFEHVATGASGAFGASAPADVLFDLEAAFKPGYLQDAKWVTRRSVVQALRKFKDTTNQYLWQPGLQAGKPAQLIGYPIVMAEDMPALAANSLSMALGNFKLGYQIVDRLGVRILRDPYTSKPYVLFYTTKRTGGAVVQFEAIKFIKFI